MEESKLTQEQIDEATKGNFEDLSPEQQEYVNTQLDRPITVCVLHKPSNQHSETTVKVRDVRRFVESAVANFKTMVHDQDPEAPEPTTKDFVVLEIDFPKGALVITALEEVMQ